MQAFDFDFDHAFGFYGKLDEYVFDSPVRYELFADLEGGGEARSVKRTKVGQAFLAVGSKMQFLFDYGDDWRFQVELIGQGEKTCQPTPEPPSLATRIRPPPHAFFAAAPVSAAVVLSSPERRFSRSR